MTSRRMIDPSFWQSESLAKHPFVTRLFFAGLFSNADDQGRIRAHPALLRSTIFPYDDIPLADIEAMVATLSTGPEACILLYRVDGKDLIQLLNWWTYQRPSWAWPSELEPPPGWDDRLCYRRGNVVVKQNWDGDETTPASASDQPDISAVPTDVRVGPEWGQSGATVRPAPSNSNSTAGNGSSSNGNSAENAAAAPSGDALALLIAYGVGEVNARKVCHEVAPERVQAWIDELDSRKNLGNPPGLLFAMLRDGIPPPVRAGPADDDWHRFEGSAFADYFEH